MKVILSNTDPWGASGLIVKEELSTLLILTCWAIASGYLLYYFLSTPFTPANHNLYSRIH